MPKVSLQKIMESIILGAKKAWKNYYEFSGGDWLLEAPEYYLTSKVFDSLGKLVIVELEPKIKDTFDNSGGKKTGKPPKNLNLRGRFDISIWWKRGYPRGVLEVKKLPNPSQKQNITYTGVQNDLKEVVHTLRHVNNNSTIQFGGCIIYTEATNGSKSSEEIVSNRLTKIKSFYKNAAKENNFSFYSDKYIKGVKEEEKTWGIICCLLVKKIRGSL